MDKSENHDGDCLSSRLGGLISCREDFCKALMACMILGHPLNAEGNK